MLPRVALSLFLLLAADPAASSRELRIGVLGLYHPRELTLKTWQGQSLLVEADAESFLLESDSQTGVSVRLSGESLLLTAGRRLVRAARIRAGARDRGAAPFLVSLPGKVTGRYHGSLEIRVWHRELVLIVTMDLETGVASAIEAEAGPKTPFEALKAQAVVARSYLVAGKGRHELFDFCDLTHCQLLREPPPGKSPSSRAAAETEGIVLAFEGSRFAAMFSQSCSGRTRTPAELALPVGAYPYFAVRCDRCRKSPDRWTRFLPAAEAALAARGETGRLSVDRRLGWQTVPGNRFTTRPAGEQIRLEGEGRGHGMGLCQRGAKSLALEGKSFRQILDHYFPNSSLELLGGESGPAPQKSRDGPDLGREKTGRKKKVERAAPESRKAQPSPGESPGGRAQL